MTALKRRIEKPRPNSRMKTSQKKSARLLQFPLKKPHRIAYERRFAGFSEQVQEALEEMYSQ